MLAEIAGQISEMTLAINLKGQSDLPLGSPTSLPILPETPTTKPKQTQPLLLSIPLEIRLQIYTYVLISHPIHHAHLSSLRDPGASNGYTRTPIQSLYPPQGLSYPTPKCPNSLTEIFLLAGKNAEREEKGENLPFSSDAQNETIPPIFQYSNGKHRPRGMAGIQSKIPTGLLSSCRQIYEETRLLPFETSTFEFVNWFWSGVYAAKQFTRALKPWQSDALRWAGVEVLVRDLSTEVSGGNAPTWKGEWRESCGFWKGVWGLRLGIKGALCFEAVEGSEEKEKEKGILDINQPWVEALMQIMSLRWVELEIEDRNVGRDEKIQFCVEGKLNEEMRESEDGFEGREEVIFSERIKRQEKGKKEMVWYGAEPGDDFIWSTDM